MKTAITALGLAAALLGAAAPTYAQANGPIKASLNMSGTLDTSTPDHAGRGQFAPGTTVDAYVWFYLETSGPQTIRFPDPADAVDFWIADGDGDYIAWLPGAAASSSVTIQPGNNLEVHAAWDQTDWYGNPVPRGIYSLEATINTSSPWDTEVQHFQVGRVAAPPASTFGSYMTTSNTTVRPGQWLTASLDFWNRTSHRRLMQFTAPWLPVKLTCLVRDSGNREIWRWTAAVPKILILGPSFDYWEPYDDRVYGPIIWPTVDDRGRPLPAGTYKVVTKLNGIPADREHVVTVRLTGAPAPNGKIDLGPTGDRTAIRTGGAVTYPIKGYVWNGEALSILYEGNYWDYVQTTDTTTGGLITGWVRKTAVVKN